MIGSFWNLCRACPSMPVDKLHSEYRSTYRWHEYTGPRQEVVRRPPQSNAPAPSGDKITNDVQITSTTRNQDDEGHNELPKMEPALPRRKKHPDLAYRHHEFLISDTGSFANNFETNNADRARSEERGGSHWRPSRRSKSEGPARGSFLNEDRDRERRRESDPDLENTGRDTGLLRKAISKISTEYRLQFAWPQGHTSRRDAAGASASAPRKSQSMGAIKPAANAIVHRKRIDLENKDASELEPLVNDATATTSQDDDKHQQKELTEYKKKFRPFSQYEYSDGRFISKRGLVCNRDLEETLVDGTNNTNNDSWYREVVELRKKAGEYKHRGWGSELAPERLTDIYNKQVELWDQVSRRSSLSALSLASTTHRSYTKEEKEEENNKKSSPTKAFRNAENSAKLVRDMIRHHLERTTGGSEFDGIILSPTREKLEPTIPRKDDDSRGSQRNSPKKNSPQKMSLQKRNAQRTKNNLRNVRSQSVGPTEMIAEKRSPKRQSRSATVKEKKTCSSASVPRRPRPSSLNTSSASSRSKSSSVPPKSEDNRSAKAKINKYHGTNESSVQNDLRKGGSGADSESKTKQNENAEVQMGPYQTDTIDLEPVVKSPPEPTRVKSPEQIIMRSPDPVNWTVPLDTGKTFTVTQNVRGDAGGRPHSEVKAWTPPEVPPPVAQSAPPELSERAKEQAGKTFSSRNDAVPPLSSVTKQVADLITAGKKNVHPIITSETNTKRLEIDPSSSKEATEVTSSNGSNRSLASEVLEKARSRFDRFWGRNSKDDDDNKDDTY